MRFEVRALSPDNLIETHTVDASDAGEAGQLLKQRQLQPLSIRAAGASAGEATRMPGRGGRSFSLLLFSTELLALLEAGLSLVEAFEALLDKETSPAARAVLQSLGRDLRDGLRFSAALARQAEVFPPLYVGIVRAAEGTSDLPQALSRYIDYQTRLDMLRSKVLSAAIYPAILLIVGGAVTLFLMAYVVPRFAGVYQGSGRSLPWLSQRLLDWGQLVGQHASAAFWSLLVLTLVAAYWLRRFIQSGRWLLFLTRLPGIGERVRVIELSRLYLTTGMLLEGGIPILAALDIVGNTVSPRTREALRAARGIVSDGGTLSQGFDSSGLATPVALRLLRVGERSGQLGVMLTRSALFYEGESARWIERFAKVFEPLLMTAIGLLIGLIVILLYMPIFDLAGTLQ
ncbi:MAG: type II secretion system F family protein [Candidatus Accumulibacter sp.]|uniref:type II secretion system F family protein n=1 Tax=Accumulibacter sp. TaxID=2053492 RepID=UPI001A06ECEC|nr:type II secretion system F family protein [Accumulibacter sp.]MBE2257970.1 type II secretion system F family protein [Paracoccaceae bacterium]MCB1940708.1 type II secretion system F family protein [Accumulibacter sp.]MCB1968758.1 type II secretion system F family protein [Accumulibacter sp.]MCP5247549.1 type II secretion system F family protein [Accumulibacter sp.]